MARITEYSSTSKLQPSDIVYVDGESGSRKITIENLKENIGNTDFTGTMAEYEEAKEAGELKDGQIVNITDDHTPGGGTGNVDDELSDESENAVQNKIITLKIKQMDEVIKILEQQASGIYEGRNLADVFDAEISRYSSEWEWIKDRIDKGFYDGIYVADWLPITVNGEDHKMQAAGIDTYYLTTDQKLGHHIDFISKDCFSQMTTWNNTQNNNGNAENNSPYMVSNVRTFILTTLYGYIPENIKRIITNKRTFMENRYIANGKLENGTGWGWYDIGDLWIPTEYEIFNSIICGTKMRSEGQAVQYPIFSRSWLHRFKRSGSGGNACIWFTASVQGDNSTNNISVNFVGASTPGYTNSKSNVPICFRIAQG